MFGPPRVRKGADTSMTSIAVCSAILISVSVNKAEFLKKSVINHCISFYNNICELSVAIHEALQKLEKNIFFSIYET